MKNNSKKQDNKIGHVKPREIEEEMQESYINYAMSVIVSRALPDVKDGLKPVHRRILYAMWEDGLRYGARFKKSASVIGSTLSRYHPHGDMAVYDALVRMAQDFSLRYPLVKGQGNFGCFTKDTKVKLTEGRNLSFERLIKEQEQGKKHWTFSFNPEAGKIEITEIKNPRLTRKNEKIMEVLLDNGERVKCTLDHRFMLRDGSYKQAQDLRPEESLMPFYVEHYHGWEDSNLKEYARNYQFIKKCRGVIPGIREKEKKNNYILRTESALDCFDNFSETSVKTQKYNHKVVKTKILGKKEDVYDLTVEPWHNFSLAAGIFVHNSIDGDSAAAYRYTEAKLSKIGEEMLKDIEKNTVDFGDNFDGTKKEPVVLPSPLPNFLLNGSFGIAVGMATNIPTHNLSEVCDALLYLIEHPKADTEDLFRFIQGPDFPTAGMIYDQKEMIQTYSQGKGPILVRGKAEVMEHEKTGRQRIVITEIPFQVQKSKLIEQLASLVQDKKIQGVKDIRDESDKEGMRIVMDLSRDSYPQKILNRLYKFTDLQKTFHLNMLALVDGIQPRVLSLVEALNYFISHRIEVVTRRIKHELKKAKERAHILEGLHKCLAKIDQVIKIIKNSANRGEAEKNLIKKFNLTKIQANAILETKLSALAKLERKKIEDELKELKSKIKEFTQILKSPQKIKGVVKKEIKKTKEDFGDKRKTKVYLQKIGEIAEEDLIPQEETIITLTQGGYIKRINPKTYKIQKRGGKGILGMKTLKDDTVKHFLSAETHDSLLFFTDSGKVFRTPVYEIPEGQRVARGRGLLNFLEISPEDKILCLRTLSKKDQEKGIKYLLMATKNGIVKKTPLKDFDNIRRTGLIAISLKKGDELKNVQKTTGQDEIILVTKKGQAIRFQEKEIRPMGRTASGIKGIRLKKGDEVKTVNVIKKEKNEKKHLAIITENGFGKRTDLKEYKTQGRGGSGVKAANINQKTGTVSGVRILTGEEENLIVISQKGQVIKTKISQIPKLSRSTQGVRLMRLGGQDKVASVTCI